MSSRFKTLRSKTVTLGHGIPQQFPIQLDPVPFEGAIVYADNGDLKYSNGTAWIDLGAGPQGTQGLQGVQGAQGVQGGYGPGFTIIGSVADVDTGGDPQATLNAAFPSATVGDGVIDQTDDELWIYDGTTWVNIGSFRGVQGFQGVQGAQGPQGQIGEEGIQGSRGYRGPQGYQGTQGTQGVQGFQGQQGVQGTQGLQGIQGTQGVQGLQGRQGTQGLQGIQGTQGVQGIQGLQGFAGSYGGVTFEYSFVNNQTSSDPGTENFKYNNADAGLSTEIYIDEVAGPSGTNISNFFDALDNVTSPTKAYMRITQVNDVTKFLLYAITEITDNSGWYTFNVTYIAGSAASADLISDPNVIITFSEGGAQGLQGPQGIQGPQGPQGFQGNQGTQGNQGIQGRQGTQGIQGPQGPQGTTGFDAGLAFRWDFNSSTIAGFPGLNEWLLNNANVTLATELYIDDLTHIGRRVDEIFDLIDNVTSIPKGQIFIRTPTDVNGNYEFLLYNILDWTWDSGPTDWGHFDVEFVERSALEGTDASPGTSWTNGAAAVYGDTAIITFIPNSQGFQGTQGTQGFQGQQGTQGFQGFQGVQGIQGFQGTQGVQGLQGFQGVQGLQGRQGTQGTTGNTGAYGGVTFEYTYLPDTAVSDPGLGNLKFDSNVLAAATILRISEEDATGNILDAFLRTIADSTSPNKGYAKITSVIDPSVFVIYRIDNLTEIGSYFAVGITYNSGNGTSTYFTTNDDVVISFTRTGDLGFQGNQGTQGFQGNQGTQGVQGYQGFQGIQGPQGPQGFQGNQGTQGFQGFQGIQGPQGPQGFQGNQGVQGVQGYQGPQGIQGTQGFQGIQGLEGNRTYIVTNDGTSAYLIDGDTNPTLRLLRGFTYVFEINASGHPFFIKTNPGTGTGNQYNDGVTNNGIQVGQLIFRVPGDAPDTLYYQCSLHASMVGILEITDFGPQGIQGPQGPQGPQGDTGPAGSFGGVTFDYTFDSGTAAADPGFGRLRFNNANWSSASLMFMNERDDNFTNIQTFLRTIDDSTSPIKGHFKITEASNPASFGIFTISSLTEIGSYFAIDCAYVNGSITSLANDADITITFARTGDIGVQGPRGDDGIQGDTGFQGAQGTQGLQGRQGTQGIQGIQGAQGTQGISGDGNQGTQGLQGIQGTQGIPGDEGPQGPQGLQGVQGFQGGQGIQGFQGMQGAEGPGGVGVQGLDGSQGSQGTQGIQGTQGTDGGTGLGQQGVQGTQGLTGDGTQGLQGRQGPQGFQGVQGPQGIGVGIQGPQGTDGFQGTQGISGDEGLGTQGIQGITGSQGTQGFQGVGDTGPQGPQGTQGIQGLQGNDGVGVGVQGNQGAQGFQGIQGSDGGEGVGVQGIQGLMGSQGTQGLSGGVGTGVQGVQGLMGAQGTQGFSGGSGIGFQGERGFQGFDGEDGNPGAEIQGVQGRTGADGFQGERGFQGWQGTQGSQGTQGFVGTGIQGNDGNQGIQGLQGPTGSTDEVEVNNIYTTALQTTNMFIPFIENTITAARPIYATLGPNPGAEQNFFYQASSDQLTVENIQVDGNLNVDGTITGGGLSGTVSDNGADVKAGGSLTFNDNVDVYFGTGQDLQIVHDSIDTYFVRNTTSDAHNISFMDSTLGPLSKPYLEMRGAVAVASTIDAAVEIGNGVYFKGNNNQGLVIFDSYGGYGQFYDNTTSDPNITHFGVQFSKVSDISGMDTATASAVGSDSSVMVFTGGNLAGGARRIITKKPVCLAGMEKLAFYVNVGGSGWGNQPEVNEDLYITIRYAHSAGPGTGTQTTIVPYNAYALNTWVKVEVDLATIDAATSVDIFDPSGVQIEIGQSESNGGANDNFAITSVVAIPGGGGVDGSSPADVDANWTFSGDNVQDAGSFRFNDNVEVEFGTGGDYEFYFSGSSMYIDSLLTSTDLFLRSASTTRFTFDMGTGNFTATGDVITESDARVKENIIDVDNALEKVMNMRGVYYNKTNSDDTNRHVGVIAQEIEEVLPEVVTENAEGMKSVAYGNVVGVLIEAIKELKAEIEELKAKK